MWQRVGVLLAKEFVAFLDTLACPPCLEFDAQLDFYPTTILLLILNYNPLDYVNTINGDLCQI